MEENKILKTKDYSIFKKLDGNRSVDDVRVRKIIKSIERVGYITSPIIVNEKMEVIDGQGRLAALEILDLPVEYIISKGIGIDECISMNIHKSNWKLIDYINSYAERGNENFKRLIKLIEKYPEFSIHVFAPATQEIGRFSVYSITEGRLIITESDYEKAVKRLDYVCNILDNLKDKRVRTEILAKSLIFASIIENVDKDRLAQKIIEEGVLLRPYRTTHECMQSIEELYNQKLGINNRVYMFTEYRILMQKNISKSAIKMRNARLGEE